MILNIYTHENTHKTHARREKSISPDRPRRVYTRHRSESPDRSDAENDREKQKDAAASKYEVQDDDDPETAAAKMEMEMMAKMGIPVNFDSTKGKVRAVVS
jgi:U4/U6.U5 tri-snRNP-associated protein 3